MTIQRGILRSQAVLYYTWSGRYFSNILISFNPLVFHKYWLYKLDAVVLLSLFLFAAYWLCGTLFNNLGKLTRLSITALFITAYLIHMPDIAQGIFWQSGAYTCFFPDILSLLLLGCIIRYYTSPAKKTYFILSCLLAIAIIGSYEINLIFIDLTILLIATTNIFKKRKLLFPLTLLAVCVVFSLFSVTAPGNSARGLFYPNSHHFLYSLKQSIVFGKNSLMLWMPFMLLIGLLLFDIIPSSKILDKTIDSIFTLSPRISFTICLTIPILGMFINFWAEGEFPQERVMNVIYFYFLIGITYFILSVIALTKKHYPNFSFPLDAKIILSMALIYLCFFQENNITSAYKDLLSGTASAYNKERTERHNYLVNFKGDSCTIFYVKNIPNTLFFYELPPSHSNGMNKVYRDYYHKKYIGLAHK